jgi:hypothetical protein
MAIKVTMLLTEKDIENVNEIFSWSQARSKAQAVSIAASLTRFLIDQRRQGATLLTDRGGKTERIIMTELESLNNEAAAAEKRKRATQTAVAAAE